MNRLQQNAVASLLAAGVLWGLTVPLSKLALGWLSPVWLTAARFIVAAPVLGFIARRELRHALTPAVLATGAVGFGGVIVLQNAGIERTTVSDAAVVIGAVPVLVAILAATTGGRRVTARAWEGNLLSLLGVVLVAHLGGGGTALGDSMVLASSALSAALVVVQPRVLARRDPAAVTAAQFGAAALVALPIALLTGGPPPAPPSPAPVAAFAILALAGTVLPFVLFAAGQARARGDRRRRPESRADRRRGRRLDRLRRPRRLRSGRGRAGGAALGIAVAMNSGPSRRAARCPRRRRASSTAGRGAESARRLRGAQCLHRVVRLAGTSVPEAGGPPRSGRCA